MIAKGVTGLDNWELREATSISADGQWVVGWGNNPSGFDEAFLANIAAPEGINSAIISVILDLILDDDP